MRGQTNAEVWEDQIEAVIGDKVIFRKIVRESTGSGLHLTDQEFERVACGEVIAVGPGRLSEETGERLPMPVKPGDIIVYDSLDAFKLSAKDRGVDRLIRMIVAKHILAVSDRPL